MKESALPPHRLAWCLWTLVVAALVAQLGCTRERYRLAADRQAKDLVAEKGAINPDWAVENLQVYGDPRSRYYDVCDPDHPPMPPDDPASHEFMRQVSGMQGWKHWYDDGIRRQIDNPNWRQQLVEYASFTPQDEVVLNIDSALQIALVNSPSYQQQLETIYLSALDVTTERFRFETQFFGGNGTSFTHLGNLAGSGLASNRGRGLGRASNTVPSERNTLQTSTDAWVEKQFATAGELAVGVANSIVWTFAGPDTNATGSLINASLVQPLLRNAGRNIALERLTIVERTLLSNLRAFQRYRKGFYTQVAIGELGVAGPTRRGGFLGGTGLTGFSGTGSGGLGGVGQATGFGRGAFSTGGGATGGGTGLAGGGAGTVGGFIGLLQQLQQIRNTEDSLALQLNELAKLEAYHAAGLITLIQVDNLRQNIETERANLLQARNAFDASLDNFKTNTLGLPPDLPIALDDRLIEQFQFLDPRATTLSRQLSMLRSEIGELPAEPEVTELQAAIEVANQIRRDLGNHFEVIREDYARLDRRAPGRLKRMEPEEIERFRREMDQEREKLAEIEQRYQEFGEQLDSLTTELSEKSAEESLVALVEWLGMFDRLIEEASLVQARARLESVILDPVELDPREALQIAQSNRLDIMNSRATLVDSWRLIAFNANALRSDVTVSLSGDMSTTGNNPVKFRSSAGSLRASLQIDPPFTRLTERNNYRQQLIEYAQDRRQYIQFMDGIHQSLRNLLRNLNQLEENLEIQRRAVAISIRRVDLTRENLSEPRPPAAPGEPAVMFGDTAALDLLNSLSDLRNTQNNFMSVWLNHYATRMVLERDLGVMDLDEDGRWIDRSQELPQPADFEELPPPIPSTLIEELDDAVAAVEESSRSVGINIP